MRALKGRMMDSPGRLHPPVLALVWSLCDLATTGCHRWKNHFPDDFQRRPPDTADPMRAAAANSNNPFFCLQFLEEE